MRPYGYEADRITIRDGEAETIREVAERLLAGESLRSVTNSINEKGARTSAGNLWNTNVLRRAVLSPRIAGLLIATGGVETPAPWPGILDADTHRKLVELFKAKRNGRSAALDTHPARTYLLTGGLAVCGLCDTPLVARPNNDGRRGYVCASGLPYGGCGRIRVAAEALEEEVAERVLARLLRPDARERLAVALADSRSAAEEAGAIIAAAEKRLEKVGIDYADGLIGATEVRAARKRLQEKIHDARRAQRLGSMLDTIAPLEAEDLIGWWEGASYDQRRTLLETIVSKVIVKPAAKRGLNRFDPSRAHVTWRRW